MLKRKKDKQSSLSIKHVTKESTKTKVQIEGAIFNAMTLSVWPKQQRKIKKLTDEERDDLVVQKLQKYYEGEMDKINKIRIKVFKTEI